MNRLYRVQPHTDYRDIWNSYHKAQKPVRQVQFGEIWATESSASCLLLPPGNSAPALTLLHWMVVSKDRQVGWVE